MGPLISSEHLEKVKQYIESGVKDGAKLVRMEENLNCKDLKMDILLDHHYLIMYYQKI